MADRIRVLRLLEYVGERKAVEEQIKRSLHGSRLGMGGKCRITAQTIGEFAEDQESDRNGECLEWIADTVLEFSDHGEVLDHKGLVDEIKRKLVEHGMPQFSNTGVQDAQS